MAEDRGIESDLTAGGVLTSSSNVPLRHTPNEDLLAKWNGLADCKLSALDLG